MRYLHVRLEQPAWMRHPMQEFLATDEAMERAALRAWNLSREDVQFALFFVEGDPAAYRERIADVAPIRWYRVAAVDDDRFHSYVCQSYTDADRAFFEAFADLRLVVVPPVVYERDGQPRLTVVGREAALTALVDRFREGGEVDVDLLEVGRYDRRYPSVTGGLTDRQYEALRVATEQGYYAAPRGASLATVADRLDVAEATASELLRRAESNLLPRVLGLAHETG